MEEATVNTSITISKKNRVLMKLLAKELLTIGAITYSESDLIISTINNMKDISD
ncbi:hypothetical protein CPAST_c16310 [Clostridium pasteurianum DSM 525 = ATCC 6013]|uniref:Uncharacterized protein n=1 Tax=Clostridium pasteurianum DSM 525 = ATCC 6013 TaxID=1262449 RepID=A0A0H3J1F2_CLOPA|nr:hypothetical protein [Clostridium pasteurianum]AJA47706.1 hypothetical protein CPAST_c16310 [Clostridium pasteurianum DSM 525 = ATCC 6013]AJA51694.1 hypothetical protein CLPA_c16310 [Clostridium pasteurianum DSM 525 = ATCC 6013]KRU12299.1 hypothetical protein CP6013_01546 [Clostridium pasteurianum DSM 525 = ATCC 6013]UZW15869.1 hypothetical protein OSC52_08645 [Clostridium pasteurianum]